MEIIKKLRDLLDEAFDEEDLIDFVFCDHNNVYESVKSESTKKGKIRCLIDKYHREVKLDFLQNSILKYKPEIVAKYDLKEFSSLNIEFENSAIDIDKIKFENTIDKLISVLQGFKSNGRTNFLQPTLPNCALIGSGDFNELEGYHNFLTIKNNMIDDSENNLIIGSPFMRYWFETEGDERMKRLLDISINLKVKIILFTKPEKAISDAEEIKLKLQFQKLKELYADRFHYIISEDSTELSYVVYDIKHPYEFDKNNRWQKAIIGYQKASYNIRPFIEFNYLKNDPQPFVKILITNHNQHFE